MIRQEMIYKMARQVNIGDAHLDDVGETIDAIRSEHDGVCSPEEYVERARPESSRTHNSLPWDDKILGESARRAIARDIIQCVVRVDKPDDDPPPLNVSVCVVTGTGDIERGYMPVSEVVKTESYEVQVEREMLVHIKGVLRNHSWLPIARQILKQIERCEREASKTERITPGGRHVSRGEDIDLDAETDARVATMIAQADQDIAARTRR